MSFISRHSECHKRGRGAHFWIPPFEGIHGVAHGAIHKKSAGSSFVKAIKEKKKKKQACFYFCTPDQSRHAVGVLVRLFGKLTKPAGHLIPSPRTSE